MNFYLDFEFKNSQNPSLDIVCVAYQIEGQPLRKHWLQRREARKFFVKVLWGNKDKIFVAYVAQAEARCMFQLLDEFGYIYRTTDFKFICLYLEYRMLTNQNDRYAYGEQLIKGKVVKTTRPPLYNSLPDDSDLHHKPEHSLAACVFKLLGERIDTEHKDKMRDLIVYSDIFSADIKTKMQVLDYCQSDIMFLSRLYENILKAYLIHLDFSKGELLGHMLGRGRFACLTAKIEQIGYPVNLSAVKKFAKAVPEILSESAKTVNEAHPALVPFELNKNGTYTLKQDICRSWVEISGNAKQWPLTDGGKLSLSLDAFEKFYNSKTPNFGGTLIKHLRLKQSLNGFLPKPVSSSKKTFVDFVGSDERVRPYQGIFGSQASRSQASATGFIPLKSHWMRALIVPPKGKAIVGIDYASQEFFIGALLSEDENMIQSYLSGDVYFDFAKKSGAIPQGAKLDDKPEYKSIRNLFKGTVLGMSYGMSAQGLAAKLSADLGQPVLLSEAEQLVDNFKNTYSDYSDWRNKINKQYEDDNYLALPDGWVMFGDNDNYRSTLNFPVQGFGACVMRKAVEYAFNAGLEVIYTLHDAIYIECDLAQAEPIRLLRDSMINAFVFYFETSMNILAQKIRLDCHTWSPEYTESRTKYLDGMPVYISSLCLDVKGLEDYSRFSKYFI